ncbi:hypothetical protein BW716_25820 [[Flexibacter] sp. ATCC 35208]|nr:hypothetical protein BW716_25820 [[Flexibacter] sp. ATCC 35208]
MTYIEKDKIVTFTLPAKDYHLQKQYRQALTDIKCELIVIERAGSAVYFTVVGRTLNCMKNLLSLKQLQMK